MNHNFKVVGCDTDSIMFCKENGGAFSIEEQEYLLNDLNSLFPSTIKWEHDGIFPRIVYVKAKNYALRDEKGKVKIKGSGLKGTMKEKALQQFMRELIDLLLNDQKEKVIHLYNRYVKEIYNLTDISKWSCKKTITESVLNPERTNEQKVLDAIEGEELQEGDKIFVYFTKTGELKLQDKWENDHDEEKLLKKLYSTLEIFETVLNMDDYPKYHLKNHDIKCRLHDVLGLPHPEKVKRTRKRKEEILDEVC